MTPPNDKQNRRRNRFHGRVGDGSRGCEWPDCEERGEFRAPPPSGDRSGYNGPGEWRYFCLEHIREFNSGYNFFDGMDADEIFDAQRPVSGWERETRAFASTGSSTGGGAIPRWAEFSDPLDAIGARFRENLNARGPAAEPGPQPSHADKKALETLGLGGAADRKAIRRRYSELVRQYHPDRNGGDRRYEKVLADVISAYTQLKESPAFS